MSEKSVPSMISFFPWYIRQWLQMIFMRNFPWLMTSSHIRLLGINSHDLHPDNCKDLSKANFLVLLQVAGE